MGRVRKEFSGVRIPARAMYHAVTAVNMPKKPLA